MSNFPPANTPRRGICTLVGAGPGDPELLTIKALRAIQAATVLLVDDLVSEAVIAFAQPSARVVHVGKRGGCKSTPQTFIEKLMLTAALEGENVVRLKGGDPFVFGRGGEEAEHLRAAGIDVHIVNGISAGLAAPSSLGVPLTHREHARGVVFVTGHAAPKNAADSGLSGEIDWQALGTAARDAQLTLVIYMGVRGAARIQAGLLGALTASTPAAVIQHATLPTQRHVVCDLGDLCGAISRAQLASPAIIVIGDVLRGLGAAETPFAQPGPGIQRALTSLG